mmetsp:Transcript_24981/g.78232  ORF Transcript_24981/g.78232 Transcript_24981/m.78232 type:complete len:217 (+) Transcript_24981:1563-2213(+)
MERELVEAVVKSTDVDCIRSHHRRHVDQICGLVGPDDAGVLRQEAPDCPKTIATVGATEQHFAGGIDRHPPAAVQVSFRPLLHAVRCPHLGDVPLAIDHEERVFIWGERDDLMNECRCVIPDYPAAARIDLVQPWLSPAVDVLRIGAERRNGVSGVCIWIGDVPHDLAIRDIQSDDVPLGGGNDNDAPVGRDCRSSVYGAHGCCPGFPQSIRIVGV